MYCCLFPDRRCNGMHHSVRVRLINGISTHQLGFIFKDIKAKCSINTSYHFQMRILKHFMAENPQIVSEMSQKQIQNQFLLTKRTRRERTCAGKRTSFSELNNNTCCIFNRRETKVIYQMTQKFCTFGSYRNELLSCIRYLRKQIRSMR